MYLSREKHSVKGDCWACKEKTRLAHVPLFNDAVKICRMLCSGRGDISGSGFPVEMTVNFLEEKSHRPWRRDTRSVIPLKMRFEGIFNNDGKEEKKTLEVAGV